MGQTTARIFKTFGSKTRGLVRNIPQNPTQKCANIDEFFTPADLGQLLSGCDYICSVLPKTAETTNILGNGILQHCAESKTCLINIGRGNIISDKDLLEALDKGWIREAILDVFNEEPLPKNHPFWLHPNIVLTPHVAGVSRPQNIAECFLTNLELHLQGEKPNNLVDWQNLY